MKVPMTYHIHFVHTKTNLPTLDIAFPTMRSAHERAVRLVQQGFAKAESITFRNVYGETITLAQMEKILADNAVTYVPITSDAFNSVMRGLREALDQSEEQGDS
jgi:hypothetical protein